LTLKEVIHMKKEWKRPHLQLLEIRETMAKWEGDSWDGFFIGRHSPGDKGTVPIDPPPSDS